MTKGIQDMLNLPSLEDTLKEDGIENQSNIEETLKKVETASKKMAQISGSDHEMAMDELFSEIKGHAQDLMDMGYNIDQARARGIFEVAASLYKHAIDAKNSKRDAQLKFMKLELDKKKLSLEEMRMRHELGLGGNEPIEATVVSEDRNELIKRLKGKIDEGK